MTEREIKYEILKNMILADEYITQGELLKVVKAMEKMNEKEEKEKRSEW